MEAQLRNHSICMSVCTLLIMDMKPFCLCTHNKLLQSWVHLFQFRILVL